MTRPGIEPRSPWPLANTVLIRLITWLSDAKTFILPATSFLPSRGRGRYLKGLYERIDRLADTRVWLRFIAYQPL